MESTPAVTFLETGDVRLRIVDFGGNGIPVLLIHGLCGTANEWFDTAALLIERAHVVAYDQRGHGESTRFPTCLSREALLCDAVAVMDAMQMQDAIVIGQSIGGRIALLLASTLVDRIRGAILVEAGAAENSRAAEDVRHWLDTWPSSFASEAEAVAFFEASRLPPTGWIKNLQRRSELLYPAFASDVMIAIVNEVANVSLWDEWTAIRTETLLVGGEHGFMERTEFDRMLALNEQARFVEIPQARHDAHLANSAEWKRVILEFVDRIVSRRQ